jgi:RING-like zinc finger
LSQTVTSINGPLVLINTNNSLTANIATAITLLSCDPDAYPGFLTPTDVFKNLFFRNPHAIILFSLTSDDSSCDLDANGTTYSDGMIYTTTSPSEASMLQMQAQSQSGIAFVISERSAVQNNTATGQSPGGLGNPSPSTAVAMIILYSITGVITALFLVIIITGAVRAHRHPERYGPRAGLGRRSAQSRARGLARAMLDTLPIVKFGEKDEDKDNADGTRDVELAGGVLEDRATDSAQSKASSEDIAEVGEDSSHNAAGAAVAAGAAGAVAGASSKQVNDAHDSASDSAPDAQPDDVYAAPEKAPKEDENLGCSICTEDFERGQDVRVLPCNHTFHPACIDPWLLNVSGTCPLW